MKKLIAAVLLMSGILVAVAPAARAEDSKVRLGVGANYWIALEDLDLENFDDSGLSGLATFQFVPSSYFKIEIDVELLPKGFLGSTEQVWLPQGYLLLGNFIYAGAGVGMYYTDGEFESDPFFALRAGIDFPLGPVHLDVNANYRFEGELEGSDVNTDSIFLGAAVRFGL